MFFDRSKALPKDLEEVRCLRCNTLGGEDIGVASNDEHEEDRGVPPALGSQPCVESSVTRHAAVPALFSFDLFVLIAVAFP